MVAAALFLSCRCVVSHGDEEAKAESEFVQVEEVAQAPGSVEAAPVTENEGAKDTAVHAQ